MQISLCLVDQESLDADISAPLFLQMSGKRQRVLSRSVGKQEITSLEDDFDLSITFWRSNHTKLST